MQQGESFLCTFSCVFFDLSEIADEGGEGVRSRRASWREPARLPVVLVVEDNPDVRRLLVLYLRGRYEVVEAATGEEAFRIVQERPVDAILMDINLPGDWSGLDAARAIRALPGMAHVPIIAQTAYAALFDEQQVLAAGCSYYMNKPIYRHELLSVLERFLSHP